MKTLNKSLVVLGIVASAISAQAGADVVDGITFNPNTFNMQDNFTQWYTSTADAASMPGTPNYAAAILSPTSLVSGDSQLTGSGLVYSLDGAAVNSNGTFASGNQLTVSFGGILLTNAATGTFSTTNSYFNFFSDSSTLYPYPAAPTSQTDVNKALDGNVFLTTKVESLTLTSGTVQNGVVSAILDITGGDAKSNFTTPIVLQLIYSGSAFFGTVSNPVAYYSSLGNGQAYSSPAPAPEPTTVALLGLGMLGMGMRRLQRNRKS